MNPFYTHSKEERGEVRSEKLEARAENQDPRCEMRGCEVVEL